MYLRKSLMLSSMLLAMPSHAAQQVEEGLTVAAASIALGKFHVPTTTGLILVFTTSFVKFSFLVTLLQ